MADAYPADKDTPTGWIDKSVLSFKNFVDGNPNLVEVQGLEGKDGQLLTAELLQLFFESDRFSGGGEIEKIYVSDVNKAALLTFKDVEVAKRLLDARLMFFYDRILTVHLPTAHMWNIEKLAILVREFVPLNGVQPGMCMQGLIEQVRTWFTSVKYRTEKCPQVVDVRFCPDHKEVFVAFEDFIDALHIMQMKGEEGFKNDEDVIGRLAGPYPIPSLILKQQKQSRSMQESVDDAGSTPDTSVTRIRIKKRKLQQGFTLEAINGMIKELGYSVQVYDNVDRNAFVFEGLQNEVENLIESNALKSSQCTSERERTDAQPTALDPSSDAVQNKSLVIEKTNLQWRLTLDDLNGVIRELGLNIGVSDKMDGSAFLLNGSENELQILLGRIQNTSTEHESRNDNRDSQSAAPDATVPTSPKQASKTQISVEETQEPHPVNLNDFLAEHRLAEEKMREKQNAEVPPCSEIPPMDFMEKSYPNGTSVVIYTEDITKIKVDVIVNAANGHMNHAGGVAQAIADAAGYDLKQQGFEMVKVQGEVPVGQNIVTTGGKLCRKVIHAVGPRMADHGLNACESIVKTTLLNALETFARLDFDLKGLQSIAIPAISSGVYGVPIDVVATALKEAVGIFDESLAKKDQPKTIHLVNINSETTQAIMAAFQGKPQTGYKSQNDMPNQGRRNERLQNTEDGPPESIGVFPARHRRSQRSEVVQNNEQRSYDGSVPGGQARQLGSEFVQDGDLRTSQMFKTDPDGDVQMTMSMPPDNGRGSADGLNRGGFFDRATESSRSFMQGSPSPPFNSYTRDVHSHESIELLKEKNLQRVPTDDAAAKVDVVPDGNGASSQCVTATPAEAGKFSPQQTNRRNNKMDEERRGADVDYNCLSVLNKEYDDLQKTYVNMIRLKDNTQCSEVERQQRNVLFTLLCKSGSFIEEKNVMEAVKSVNDAKILFKELEKLSHMTEGNQRNSTGAAGEDDRNVNYQPSKSTNPREVMNTYISNDGGLAKQQGNPPKKLKGQEEEPMDTDDKDSSDSSFEVIDERKDKLRSLEPYNSSDEDDASLLGAIGNRTKSVKTPVDDCSICFEVITDLQKLDKCGHTFCKPCIEKAFDKCGPKCPLCNTMYGKMRGTQPGNGIMRVNKQKFSLPGYATCGTIVIKYSFPDGIQQANHPHPRRRYSGTNRTAYLPDNPNGNKVMKLLRQAFEARLVFTIGESATTGKTDTVVWNNIHHKTSTTGGPQQYGYPDTTYLTRVIQELAAFGIK